MQKVKERIHVMVATASACISVILLFLAITRIIPLEPTGTIAGISNLISAYTWILCSLPSDLALRQKIIYVCLSAVCAFGGFITLLFSIILEASRHPSIISLPG